MFIIFSTKKKNKRVRGDHAYPKIFKKKKKKGLIVPMYKL